MKTIKRLFLSIIGICLLTILLTGCFSEETTSIKITQMPSTTFTVGTTDIDPLMTVEINDKGSIQTVTLSIKNNELVSTNTTFKLELKNFNLAHAGSYTASVKYGDVVSYFDYQVIANDSLFAGGDGSIKNPYQITTPEQLLNINKLDSTKDINFKLMNDIDMTSVVSKGKLKEIDENSYAVIESFSGVFDGNGKKLFNINVSNDLGFAVSNAIVIFGSLEDAEIKNFDIYINNTQVDDISIVLELYGNVKFENVDMYGSTRAAHNHGNYAIYSNADSVTTFKDCNNFVDIVASEAKYIAVYVGYSSGGTVSFENCFNYGYIEALKVAVFIANAPTPITIKYVNSGNKGTLSSVEEESNVISATNSEKVIVNTAVSTGLATGTIKQIPAYDIKANTEIVNNKLTFKGLDETSNIKSVKVSFALSWMPATDKSTNSAYLNLNYNLSTTSTTTDLYLTKNDKGELAIKIVKLEDYTKAEGETEVTFDGCDWLKYNVEQGLYVFDGTKVIPGTIFTGFGSPMLTVLAYNAAGEVVQGQIIKLIVVK